jgi:serine/threonine-protein kinase
VRWPEGDQPVNVPTTTDVTVDCAWAVESLSVPAQGTATVTAEVELDLGGDPEAALQEWLDGAAAATTEAVEDPGVRGTAYPAQRMRGVEIVAPPRTVSGRTLTLRVLPVWPSGADRLNPVYQSPSVGEPSSMLSAIAGGEKGVRFSDGCSGALAVQNGGLVVTALSPAPECTVVASVGNFVNVASAPFAIVTRGG